MLYSDYGDDDNNNYLEYYEIYGYDDTENTDDPYSIFESSDEETPYDRGFEEGYSSDDFYENFHGQEENYSDSYISVSFL